MLRPAPVTPQRHVPASRAERPDLRPTPPALPGQPRGRTTRTSTSPRLGLPRLAVVTWPEEPSAEEEQDERQGLHWKTRTLVRWAAGRAFAWADDEITSADRNWVAACHPGQALLHCVNPATGITEADYRTIGQWLHGVGPGVIPPDGPLTNLRRLSRRPCHLLPGSPVAI